MSKIEYKWVIRVRGDNNGTPQTYYYNGAMFMLVSNPYEASRYSSETPDEKHVKHAMCQGGQSDIITYEQAMKDYKEKLETI